MNDSFSRNGTSQQNDHLPLTDVGNAHRLAREFGDQIRHAPDGWYVYDGKQWKPDDPAVRRMCMEVAIRIQHEDFGASPSQLAEILRWHKTSQGSARLYAMKDWASSLTGISISSSSFDANPDLLNCLNGTLDLRTGKLGEHDPNDLLTLSTNVNYDPEAKCPQFLEFLWWACRGDEEMMRYLQKALGSSLTGKAGEHLFILYGSGGNGKGVTTYVVQQILGGYAQQAPNDLFTRKKHDKHSCVVARLRGQRFVVAAELGVANRLDDVQVKQLTGGDVIAARQMYEGYEEFYPSQSYFLSTNNLPYLDSVDDAIRRRVVVLPFDAKIRGRQDEGLKARLVEEEGKGILAWLVEGYRRSVEDKRRLDPTGRIEAATEAYFLSCDPVERFLRESCTREPSCKEKATNVHEAYEVWCSHNKEHAMSNRSLYSTLETKGCALQTGAGNQRFIAGLELKGAFAEETTMRRAA